MIYVDKQGGRVNPYVNDTRYINLSSKLVIEEEERGAKFFKIMST